MFSLFNAVRRRWTHEPSSSPEIDRSPAASAPPKQRTSGSAKRRNEPSDAARALLALSAPDHPSALHVAKRPRKRRNDASSELAPSERPAKRSTRTQASRLPKAAASGLASPLPVYSAVERRFRDQEALAGERPNPLPVVDPILAEEHASTPPSIWASDDLLTPVRQQFTTSFVRTPPVPETASDPADWLADFLAQVDEKPEGPWPFSPSIDETDSALLPDPYRTPEQQILAEYTPTRLA